MPCYGPIFLLFFVFWTLSSSAEDARALLQASLAKYASLPSYYIEGTREEITTDAIQHDWHEDVFVIAEAPGKRYHYDIKTPYMWNVVVSNGTSEWDFQPWRNEYAQRSAPELIRKAAGPEDLIRASTARTAKYYLEDVANQKIRTAEFLPDETITLTGEQIPCHVVRANLEEVEDLPVAEHLLLATYWIEQKQEIIRKKTVDYVNSDPFTPMRKLDTTTTTTFIKVELHDSPPNVVFNFAPPTGAKLIERLFLSDRSVDLTGLNAPPLKLKTLDGRPFDTASLKGHPVLLDFWASWCVPCVQQMPGLAALNDKYGPLGLVVIGVNWNDDRSAATEFLRKNNYHWLNLRDVQGETAKSWRLNGVPLLAIIAPDGTIAYYHTGYEEPEQKAILDALKKVDPAYSNVSLPCETVANAPSKR
jgi:thiol-disulfide isomerase/thioredoxin